MHVFESAIDLLSYATMQKLDGKEWRTEHLLSLAGVYQPAKRDRKKQSPSGIDTIFEGTFGCKKRLYYIWIMTVPEDLQQKAIQTVVPKKNIV